nr:uncharacterized protein LOC100178956 [Ciona intestinalis]|eukprot:XP_002119419.1 uncharacterized protein LOC100178956 [Ciona intestinalis]
MSDLTFVYSWLSSQLELHGIDSIIYSRHVINLLINSHYTNDIHLAHKEETIFASLPGSKKRKPKAKYNKRSNSFTFPDEVLMKKQMAVNCLRSAVDDSTTPPLEGDIESLIENLYNKLKAVHLFSDGKLSSSSDEGQNVATSVKQKKRREFKENYHDVFPSLKPGETETQTNNLPECWKKHDVSTPETNPDPKNPPRTRNLQKPRRPRKKKPHPPEYLPPDKTTHPVRSNPRWIKDDGNPRWIKDGGRRRGRKGSSSVPANLHLGKENISGNTKNQNKRKITMSQRNQRKLRKQVDPGFEASIDDVTHRFMYPGYLASKQNLLEEDICHLYTNHELPTVSERPQSKWFRDPESGFLEFEPAHKSPHSPESVVDGSESWLWCPSPSLWEGDDGCPLGGSVSRLETIYKPRLTSSEKVTGQLWEGYRAIFADVAKDSEVDDSSSFFDLATPSVESSEEPVFSIEINENKTDLNGNYLPPQCNAGNNCYSGDCDACSIFDESTLSITERGCFGIGLGKPPPDDETLQSRRRIWLQNTKCDVDCLESILDVGYLSPHNEYGVAREFDLNFNPWVGGLGESLSINQFFCELSTSLFDVEGWMCGWGGNDDDTYVASLVHRVLEVVVDSLHEDDDKLPGVADKPTLDDCVTRNEAWKTSLRIGNIWQNISGIRPIDIVYSEKQSSSETMLQPSSLTHFRPINNEGEETSTRVVDSFTPADELSDNFLEFSATSPQKPSQQKQQQTSGTNQGDTKSFRPKFRKLGEDKCLQTTFEEQMRSSGNGRPPKANSR